MSGLRLIKNPHNGKTLALPNSVLRLCAQCLEPMPLDYVRWDSETEVTLMYLCQHKGTSRYKTVRATVDKKGRLSCL